MFGEMKRRREERKQEELLAEGWVMGTINSYTVPEAKMLAAEGVLKLRQSGHSWTSVKWHFLVAQGVARGPIF